MASIDVAMKFVQEINSHDAAGLVGLMTADHVFVDSLGGRTARPAIEAGWEQYFAMVPDYWIRVDSTSSSEGTAILLGSAGGTYVPGGGAIKPENRWEAPAAWVARIRDGKVSEWRVYSDNEPIRARIRASSP